MRVVYIAGSGRSGSTMLHNILGSYSGALAAGEVRYLWERGVIENRLCGCGERFDACPVWRKVTEATGLDEERARSTVRALRSTLRARSLPTAMVRTGAFDHQTTALRDEVAQVYAAMASATGASTIIDSSKLPLYGHLLVASGLDVVVVHLVRDPRAAAFSWSRVKEQPDHGVPGKAMLTQSPTKSSLLWDVWNTTASTLLKREATYVRVSYEAFAAAPRATVERIASVVGLAADDSPFTGDRTVRLGVNHSVAGNPNRLAGGEVTIREDDEWRSSMPTPQRLLVTTLTLPVLTAYRIAGDAPAPVVRHPQGAHS